MSLIVFTNGKNVFASPDEKTEFVYLKRRKRGNFGGGGVGRKTDVEEERKHDFHENGERQGGEQCVC